MQKNSSLDNQKNAAYLVYSEWGPQRSIPRDRRLRQAFPGISAKQRAAWLADFINLDREIWKAAEAGGSRTTSFEEFKKRMLKAFPFMNEAALRRAWTLAGYYTWHEGY